jgi:hypothetical protein
LLTFENGDDYLFRSWNRVFGRIEGVKWGNYNQFTSCERVSTWEQIFSEMHQQRASTLESEWPLLTPKKEVNLHAQMLWNNITKEHGTYVTVHGRSFESSSDLCLSSSAHSPYTCTKNDLCDYRLSSIIERFGIYLNNTTNPYHFILFTDGQNKEYSKSYPLIENENELFTQMWMMVVSKVHIGHPASSQDYVVWRWRKQLRNPQAYSYMLPWQCYNNITFH